MAFVRILMCMTVLVSAVQCGTKVNVSPRTVVIELQAEFPLNKDKDELISRIQRIQEALNQLRNAVVKRESKVFEFSNDIGISAKLVDSVREESNTEVNLNLELEDRTQLFNEETDDDSHPSDRIPEVAERREGTQATPVPYKNVQATTSPQPRNDYFIKFILNVMSTFIHEDYDEAYTYAKVVNNVLTDRYINKSAFHEMGAPFVKLVRNCAAFARKLPANFLQARIAYIYTFVLNRRVEFTKEMNSILDYVDDKIYNSSDKLVMDGVIRDLRNPRKIREDVVKDIIEKTIIGPVMRLPLYHRKKLVDRLSEEIKRSSFHTVFDDQIRMSNAMDFDEYSMDQPSFDWKQMSSFFGKFVDALLKNK